MKNVYTKWDEDKNLKISEMFVNLKKDTKLGSVEICDHIARQLNIKSGKAVYTKLHALKDTDSYSYLQRFFKPYKAVAFNRVGKPPKSYQIVNVPPENQTMPLLDDNLADRVRDLELTASEQYASHKKLSGEMAEIHTLLNGLSDYQDETKSYIKASNGKFTALLVANLALAAISAWMTL